MKIFGNNSQLTDLTSFCTIERLSNIKFDNVDILKIPKNLGINKVNGDDNLKSESSTYASVNRQN